MIEQPSSAQSGWGGAESQAQPSPAAFSQNYSASGSSVAAVAQDRPEIAAGAAFTAGFLFAMILRRLAG